MLKKIIKINIITSILLSNMAMAADCSSDPIDPRGSVVQLKESLQQASNTGKPLRIAGTYYINSDIQVFLKKDLSVDATGANFIATSELDGDMFSFDSNSTKSTECNSADIKANFSWNGGSFNMAQAKVSTVVPQTSKTPQGREGTKATADALSIRGVDQNGASKLNELLIENIQFTGTTNPTDPFYLAGGDSGILMTGALKATIRNNAFYGVRDAAIYVSAGGNNGVFGDHFTLSNNYVERAYDGITSKRGADNIKMLNNIMEDVVVGLSTKMVYSGWTATNIIIKGNEVTRAVRAISVERSNNVTIEDNQILELGGTVANQDNPINPFGQQYEGISLNGIQGTNYVRYNHIVGLGDSRVSTADTYGLITRDYDGRSTTGLIKSGNVYANIDKIVKQF
ncbi:right-handed parallel beta-helix repeat-containing protein [Pseudomonadota bacterium]